MHMLVGNVLEGKGNRADSFHIESPSRALDTEIVGW